MFVWSNFLFLSRHNTVLMLWMGLGTNNTWLGVRKTTSCEQKQLVLTPEQKTVKPPCVLKNIQCDLNLLALISAPRLSQEEGSSNMKRVCC